MKAIASAEMVREADAEPGVELGSGRTFRWNVTAGHVDMSMPAPPPLRALVRAEPQNITVDLNRSAMIVVDMQNDFCAEGGWCDHLGADLAPERAPIAPLQRLLPVLRGAGVPIIWLNWGNRPDRANLEPPVLHVFKKSAGDTGIGEPVPGEGARLLEKDSWGAAVVDGLAPMPGDVHVDKFRISGFWDTPLDSILRNLRVDTLIFAGVNSDQCVYATLIDAACLGYDVVMLTDASATTSPSYCHDATVYNTRQCFGFTASTPDLLDALTAAKENTE
jgi:nicotinamidase-related amidase